MGRTDCSAPALILDNREVHHDLKYMKWPVWTSFSNYRTETLESLVYSSLFNFGELRSSSQRDAPSTSWVCMGLSRVPNPLKSWNTLQNNTLNFLFSSSSKSRAISAYWERGCSQINTVFLYSEQTTLWRYDVPRNGSRLFKIENLWTFSFYLCSSVNKCLVWLLLNVAFLEWK